MTRAEKVAEAQRLRAQGLTYREIGERMGGYPKSTVHGWISDPDRSLELARKRGYAGTCIDCGAPTNGTAGPGKAGERCLSCRATYDHETRYWTPERIVTTLRVWAEDFGRPPTATEAQQVGCPVMQSTVNREFGSWNAGIAAAGFTPRAPGERSVSGYRCRKVTA